MLVLLRDKAQKEGTKTVEISQKLINTQLNHFVHRGIIQNTHHVIFILYYSFFFLGESRPGELHQFFDSTKGISKLCMCDLVLVL